MVFLLLCFFGTAGSSARLLAHPMPDTEIGVERGADLLRLTIQAPWSDLKLALPEAADWESPTLSSAQREALRAYFASHLHITIEDGKPVSTSIEAIRLTEASDEHVGHYREIAIDLSVQVPRSVPLVLRYDGIIHRVVNHRALVRDAEGSLIGIVRFSLAEKKASQVTLPAPTAAAITEHNDGHQMGRASHEDASSTAGMKAPSEAGSLALWVAAAAVGFAGVLVALAWRRRRSN